MTLEALTIVNGFASCRVTVLGDAILDGYLEGFAERVCREAPVPVVRLRKQHVAAGGAANMATNLAAMGADVRFVSLVGDDADARELVGLLERSGVDCSGVVADSERTTIAKRRLVADSQLLVRYDTGDTHPPGTATSRLLLSALDKALSCTDALIVSDYRSGVLTDAVIAALDCRRSALPLLVVDSAALAEYRRLEPDLAKPSIAEALAQLAVEPSPPSSRMALAEALGDSLLDLSGADRIALTLDSDGCIVFQRGQAPIHGRATHQGPAYPAGAGDTFLGAFTLSLLSGADARSAAEVAQAAAGLVVAREGTSICTAEELRAAIAPPGAPVIDATELEVRLEHERAAGKRIVFTNGCFDILHPGHIALLEQAKERGDVLVVALNDDEQVRELKGPGRPVNTLDDRVRVLSAVSAVDYLVAFGEPTAERLIERVRPDVYVKGGDYSAESIPEATAVTANGGRVEILPYFGSQSTSSLIDRIRRMPMERVV